MTNAGILTVEDLYSANSCNDSNIGAKKPCPHYERKGEKVSDVPVLFGKSKRLRSMLGTSGGIEALTQTVAPLTERSAPEHQHRSGYNALFCCSWLLSPRCWC